LNAASIGESPQDVEGGLDVSGEDDRIERPQLTREFGVQRGRDDAGGEGPLIGRLRRIVASHDPAADATLAEQHADGAEEVVLEPEQAIQPLEGGEGGRELQRS
jgi:hypothetical protein